MLTRPRTEPRLLGEYGEAFLRESRRSQPRVSGARDKYNAALATLSDEVDRFGSLSGQFVPVASYSTHTESKYPRPWWTVAKLQPQKERAEAFESLVHAARIDKEPEPERPLPLRPIDPQVVAMRKHVHKYGRAKVMEVYLKLVEDGVTEASEWYVRLATGEFDING